MGLGASAQVNPEASHRRAMAIHEFKHRIVWVPGLHSEPPPSRGIHLLRMEAGDFPVARKMVILE
jgi:hypothetical protein